jgi:hypothetical protein
MDEKLVIDRCVVKHCDNGTLVPIRFEDIREGDTVSLYEDGVRIVAYRVKVTKAPYPCNAEDVFTLKFEYEPNS